MRKRLVAVGLVMTMLLSGCTGGEMQVDTTQKEGAKSGSAQFDGEHLSFVYNDGEQDLQMECDVNLVGYEDSALYEMEQEEIDEEYIKKFASNLFDDGSYSVLEPYGLLSNQELDALEQEYDETGFYMSAANTYIMSVSYFKDIEKLSMPQNQILVPTKVAGGAMECRLQGYIDDKLYELDYINSPRFEPKMSIHPVKLEHRYQSCMIMERGTSDDSDGSTTNIFGENVCDYDQTIAYINQLKEKLGFQDFEIASMDDRACQVDDEEQMRNIGYHCVLTRTVGNIPTPAFDGEPEKAEKVHKNDEEELDNLQVIDDSEPNQLNYEMVEHLMQENDRILIDVDDNGIAYMQLYVSPGTPVLKDSQTEKLDLNQCIECFKDALNEWGVGNFIQYYSRKGNQVNMQATFTYVPVRYDEKTVVYEPVLVFHRIADTSNKIPKINQAILGISIIDGSLIGYKPALGDSIVFQVDDSDE